MARRGWLEKRLKDLGLSPRDLYEPDSPHFVASQQAVSVWMNDGSTPAGKNRRRLAAVLDVSPGVIVASIGPDAGPAPVNSEEDDARAEMQSELETIRSALARLEAKAARLGVEPEDPPRRAGRAGGEGRK